MITNEKNISVIGDNSEALLLSVLLAETGNPNTLLGPFSSAAGEEKSPRITPEIDRLLQIHTRSDMVQKVHSINDLQTSDLSISFLTEHTEDASNVVRVERQVRDIAAKLKKGQTVVYTGLCPPSFTRQRLKMVLNKHSGLRVGDEIGLCYVPLLWNGERLQTFTETPKLIAGLGTEHLQRVQEVMLSVFPSMSVASSLEAAEAGGLCTPVYREIMRALELELAQMCVSRGVDYSTVMNLCLKTTLGALGGPNLASGNDLIASKIFLESLGKQNRPQLVRTAKRVNEEAPQQVLAMVRDALAQCGRRVRRSRITFVGVDALGVDRINGFGDSGIIRTLVRRGAIVSVYPGEINSGFGQLIIPEGLRLKLEPDLTRAVQKAQCAIIALKPSREESFVLTPQKLAAEMDRPAAICDLSRVMEASNVERSGLFYTSIGRGNVVI
jgi:UDP-N-acetyl-D-mannosaminuronate dehydrogenase